MKVFVTADLHFNHANIIKYCKRPFDTTFQMNEALIANWNSVVSDADIVYVLGDIIFGLKDNLKSILSRMNGHKSLLLGNHDKQHHRGNIQWWYDSGFDNVYIEPYLTGENGDFIMSHEPIEDSKIFNIHAHTHNDETWLGNLHYCVSVEMTDYKPVLLTEILDKLRRRTKWSIYYQ